MSAEEILAPLSITTVSADAVAPTGSTGDSLLFRTVRIVLLSLGILGNAVFLAFLIRHRVGSAVSTILVRVQSVVDILIASMAIAINLQLPYWLTGLPPLDVFFCRLWHSQLIYWFFVLYSVYITIYITLDRFLLFQYPFFYRNRTTKQCYVALFVLALLATVFNGSALFEANYLPANGTGQVAQCVGGYQSYNIKVLKEFFPIYAILWFLVIFAIPSILTIVVYAVIIYKLRQPQDLEETQETKKKISVKFTIASAIISFCFVVCFSLDTFFYLLNYWGEVTNYWGSWLQAVSVFLISLNSCINPFVYLFLLNGFRNFLFGICLGSSTDQTTSEGPKV